jgi:hypothetical protein
VPGVVPLATDIVPSGFNVNPVGTVTGVNTTFPLDPAVTGALPLNVSLSNTDDDGFPGVTFTASVIASIVARLIIVPVASIGAVVSVFVDATVPVNVKVSVTSLILSVKVGTRTDTDVCPAGIVTVIVVEVKSGDPAVPFKVVISTTVGTELGLLSVTANTALLPSNTVTLSIVTIGIGSLSIMVPVPVADAVAVLVLVTVPLNINVSIGSFVVSCVVGAVTVTLVCPAGIVTVVVVVV